MNRFQLILLMLVFSVARSQSQITDTIYIDCSKEYNYLNEYKNVNKYNLILIDSNKGINEIGTAREGLREGTWISYKNGTKTEMTNYVNGKKQGPHVLFYNNNSIKVYENYYQGAIFGISCEYTITGKIITIKYYRWISQGKSELKQNISMNEYGQVSVDVIKRNNDSLIFTDGSCGNLWTISSYSLDDSTVLNGNRWYDNGNPEIIVIPRTENGVVVFDITRYKKDGGKIYSGSCRFVCDSYQSCCWEKNNDWVYYK